MGRIVAIEALHSPPRRRACIRLDDGQTIHLSLSVLAEAGLAAGQELSEGRLAILRAGEEVHRGLDKAHRLLSYRPRSRVEMESRLLRAGIEPGAISQVVHLLEGQGLLDDSAFARFWREHREQGHPLGRQGLLWELRHLGIEADLASEAVAGLDEEACAYAAAGKLARHLPLQDEAAFRRRLSAGLRRRGFAPDTVRAVVAHTWVEARAPEGMDSCPIEES